MQRLLFHQVNDGADETDGEEEEEQADDGQENHRILQTEK